MKAISVFLLGTLFSLMSLNSIASGSNSTEIISCKLPGDLSRKVSLSIDNETKEINYSFEKEGKVELAVLFNEENKLKRLTDSEMGVTYYGFKRGAYSYIIDIINGVEKEEYTISFDIRKNNKVVQSDDCLHSSFRSADITSQYITDVPYVDDDNFAFP